MTYEFDSQSTISEIAAAANVYFADYAHLDWGSGRWGDGAHRGLGGHEWF